MAQQKFIGVSLDRAEYLANAMYHDGNASVTSIAKQLGCGWHTANRLISHCREKWEQRKRLGGSLPLHFDEVFAA